MNYTSISKNELKVYINADVGVSMFFPNNILINDTHNEIFLFIMMIFLGLIIQLNSLKSSLNLLISALQVVISSLWVHILEIASHIL